MTNKKNRNSPSKGWPDFWINLTNKVYLLINSGNLVGLFAIIIFMLFAFIIMKLPPEELPSLLLGIAGFFKECWLLVVLLSIYTISSTIIFQTRDKIYRQEIQRLTDIRKDLTHGIENGTLKPIKHHTTSSFNILEEK